MAACRYQPQHNPRGLYFRAVLKGESLETIETVSSKRALTTRVEVCSMSPLLIPADSGEFVLCNISCSVSTAHHFVRLCDSGIRNIESSMEELDKKGGLRVFINPAKGALAVTRLPDTGKCARCVILEKNGVMSTRVFFVDYGQTASIDSDQVFFLDDNYLRHLPPQAFPVNADIEDHRLTDRGNLLLRQHSSVSVQILGTSEDERAFRVHMEFLCKNNRHSMSIRELLEVNDNTQEDLRSLHARSSPAEDGNVRTLAFVKGNISDERQKFWGQSNGQPVQQRQRRGVSNSSNQPVCHSCRGTGHVVRNCPLSVCYNCHGKGHMSLECPKIDSGRASSSRTTEDLPHTQGTTNRFHLDNNSQFTRKEHDKLTPSSRQVFYARNISPAALRNGGKRKNAPDFRFAAVNSGLQLSSPSISFSTGIHSGLSVDSQQNLNAMRETVSYINEDYRSRFSSTLHMPLSPLSKNEHSRITNEGEATQYTDCCAVLIRLQSVVVEFWSAEVGDGVVWCFDRSSLEKAIRRTPRLGDWIVFSAYGTSGNMKLLRAEAVSLPIPQRLGGSGSELEILTVVLHCNVKNDQSSFVAYSQRFGFILDIQRTLIEVPSGQYRKCWITPIYNSQNFFWKIALDSQLFKVEGFNESTVENALSRVVRRPYEGAPYAKRLDNGVKNREGDTSILGVATEAEAMRLCIKRIVKKKVIREELKKVDPELLEELQRYVKLWEGE